MDGISVVIPTLNRTSFVYNTVRMFERQDFGKPFEIIVVDQSDAEDIQMKNYVPKSDLAITYHYYHVSSFRGLPEARNFGWQHANYDYILYIDDDVEISDCLLSEHYKCLVREGVGVVAGGITEKFKRNPTNVSTGVFHKFSAAPERGFNIKSEIHEVDHGPGGNYSIRKDVIREIGGVDERLNVGAALYEESETCLRVKRLGYKILFNYDAHLYHLAAETGGCRVKDIFKYIYALVHNRSLVINRHLNGMCKITATLYLMKLVLSYSLSYKKNLFPSFLEAYRVGKHDGGKRPKCTDYRGV